MKKILGNIGVLIFGIGACCDSICAAAVGIAGLLMILYASRGEEYEED